MWTHIGRGTPICLPTTNTRMLLLRAAASSHALPSRAAVTPSLQSVRMRAFVATPALPYPRAAVAVTVLRHEDDCDTMSSERQYLLAQRANNPGAGTWSLPGGKINLGETFLNASAREIFEETALGPDELRLSPWPIDASDVIVPTAEGENVAFHYVLTQCFAFAEPGVTPRGGDDASAVRWATLAEVESGALPLGGNVGAVLRRAEALLERGALIRDECVTVAVDSVNPPGT